MLTIADDQISMKKVNEKMRGRLLVPIGSPDMSYFALLEKHKKFIGGIFISWPDAPSGRIRVKSSKVFFHKMYLWCRKNQKVFDIVFNMEPHDFNTGFDYKNIDLEPYRSELTELTFSSMTLFKSKVFNGFKKNISVNMRIGRIQQLHALVEDNLDINCVILDRDTNRSRQLMDEIIAYAKKRGIEIDILVNEGCVPFCPNKKDHAIFTTLGHFSDQAQRILKMREICANFSTKEPWNILRSPFLTREALFENKARFFKICDRTLPPRIMDKIISYYAEGKPLDIGIIFSNQRRAVGLSTEMLPAAFHRRIQECGNNCQSCNFCKETYLKILKNK